MKLSVHKGLSSSIQARRIKIKGKKRYWRNMRIRWNIVSDSMQPQREPTNVELKGYLTRH